MIALCDAMVQSAEFAEIVEAEKWSRRCARLSSRNGTARRL